VPFAALREAGFGPDPLFTAAQRYVSYQGRTRHSTAAADTAAPDPKPELAASPAQFSRP